MKRSLHTAHVRADTPLRSNRAAIAVCAFVFTLCVFTALVVFDRYPFALDEYNLLYQSKIFLSGKTWIPIKPELAPLTELYTVVHNGRFFIQYPPGFSLLLAPFALLQIESLLNPIITALGLYVTYLLILAYVEKRFAVTAIALLASNVYLIGYGGSLFSGPVILLLAATSIYSVRLAAIELRTRRVTLFAASILSAILIRPLDALCIFVPCFAYLLCTINWSGSRSELQSKLAPLLIIALGPILLMAWTYTVSAQIGLTPIQTFTSGEFALIRTENPLSLENLTALALEWITTVQKFTVPNIKFRLVPFIRILLFIAAIGLFRLRWRHVTFALAIPLLFLLGYGFHIGSGFPLYGERYLYPCLPVLGLLIAHGVEGVAMIATARSYRVFLALAFAVQLADLATQLKEYNFRVRTIKSIQQDIEVMCPPKSLVVLTAPSWWPKYQKRFIIFNDLKRNPFHNGDRLYVASEGEYAQVAPALPKYNRCDYSPLIEPEGSWEG